MVYTNIDDEFPDVSYEKLVRETEKAYLFLIGKRDIWLPKSEVEDLDELEKTFNIPRWLAERNNLV